MNSGPADRRRAALRDFIQSLGLRPASWARGAGISPSTLYNFLHGRSDSLSQPTLEALGHAVGRPVSELTGENRVRASTQVQPVTVLGAVEAGHWLDALEWPPAERFEIMVTPARRRRTHVFGLVVRGPSMNLRYPEGSVLVCAPVRHLGRPFGSGDRVIVERRHQDGRVEATVKELFLDADGRAWLWPRSTHPKHQQPIAIPWPPDPGQHPDELGIAEISTIALVVGAYHHEE